MVLFSKLKNRCSTLSIFPLRGRSRDDLRKNLRVMALDKKSVAAFEVHEKGKFILVLGIFYGGRDYELIMGDSEGQTSFEEDLAELA